MFLRQAPDALDFPEDAHRAFNDAFAGGSDLGQGAAFTHEDRKTQLVFELFELFADPRLGGMQFFRSGGDIQVIFGDGGQIS